MVFCYNHERERQRDTSNQAFWGGKTPIWDREEGREREREREREKKRDTERYVKSSILGWKDTNLGQRGREREREREKERHREIRQIKLFGVGRANLGRRGRERERDTSNQAFWGGKTPIWDREEGGEREREREKERHREIRQIKHFGVERHQFGTERKGERERERKRETQRDTSNQAFWGGKTPIWDGQTERDRQRWLDTSSGFPFRCPREMHHAASCRSKTTSRSHTINLVQVIHPYLLVSSCSEDVRPRKSCEQDLEGAQPLVGQKNKPQMTCGSSEFWWLKTHRRWYCNCFISVCRKEFSCLCVGVSKKSVER